jgi:putative ABC transport system permease protein
MPDWKRLVIERLPAGFDDPDVVEELAEHAQEVYRTARSAGRSEKESFADVEAELTDLPAVIRAAQASRRRRLSRALEPAAAARPSPLAAFGRDLRYALRALSARPGVTLLAVFTLALGIGANTAIFSVTNAILLSGLPFPDAGRLVMLWEQEAADPRNRFIVSKPNYDDWSASIGAFERTAIWEFQSFNIAGDGEPEQVAGLRASASLFPLLGIPPQLGRTFTPAEDAPGHNVVIISDGLWRRRYAQRPDIVGQVIRLNGKPYEIVGVMPREFVFVRRADAVWVPIQYTEQDEGRGSHSFYAAARLKPGVSFEAAKLEMEALGRRLAAQYEENAEESASITPMAEFGVVHLRGTLLTTLSAVALVLLIACANVANLLLGQAFTRSREFAIRAALGASRWRLASQLLAEGLVLASLGALAGLGVAWAGTAGLSTSLPPAIRLAPFRDGSIAALDVRVLAFTLVAAVVTGVLFSLAPALHVANAAPAHTLKAAGGRSDTGRFTAVRGALVAIEIALSVVVLTAAGLTIKSMMRLVAVDPGLDPSHVLVMQVALPQVDTYGPPERTSFCVDVARELSSVPGVLSSGAMSHLPLSGANAGRGLTIEGRPAPDPASGASANYRLTCPGYFKTLGIPVLAGRDFSDRDSTEAAPVVIVNEVMASRYWPGESVVGKRLKFGGEDSSAPWLTVVGVVRNVRHFGLDSEPVREIYRPYSQAAWPVMTVTAKTAPDPISLAPAIRAAARRIDPEAPVTGIRVMDDVITASVGSYRFPMLLFGAFAVLALVLAIVGVYGVVSYLVSQRTREIGIRMALGARPSGVVRLVVTRSLVPIALGTASGIVAALLTSRFVGAMLYDVKPSDPWVLTMIASGLAAVGITASWIPARRAASVDPLTVLRAE